MKKKQELSEANKKQLEIIADNMQKVIANLPKFELPIIKQSEALAKQLQEFGKAITLKYGILENDYNDFINQYTPYFIKNGIITPKDFKQFFNWLASCKYPYESFGMVEICENDFLHFHEYKEILFNNRNWSEEEERERLESKESNTIESEQAKKPQRKQGRPKTEIHEASYYLHNKKLLQFLIDNYSNIKPRVFNQLLSVLSDTEINQLKPATKKEYNVAFGKALNVKQAQSNFDNYFNKTKIEEIFEPIKATIKTYLNSN